MKNNQNMTIGRVLATEKHPTTIDDFAFWTESTLILNPFDIVKVDHVNGTYTYGMIEDISHITDAASFLTSYISSDFGDVNIDEPTLRVGMNYVKAKVVCNTENIYIPVQNGARVHLATADEINYALGLKDIKNPLCCGYLEMYEGTGIGEKVTLPVNVNAKFVIGPEGAHLNISGISGLASKTSYAMFLMRAIQDKYIKSTDDDDSVAFVFFNVKGKDLLAIDQKNDFLDDDDKQAHDKTYALYKDLHISTEPFQNVHYYYPYSDKIHWNTYMKREDVERNFEKKQAKFFSYIYEYDKESLDLLFSDIDDSTQTMDAIINYIITGQGEFDSVNDWNDFLQKVGKMCGSTDSQEKKSSPKKGTEIPVVSWRKFYRIVNKAINDKAAIFRREIGDQQKEVRLGDALKYIKKNDVHVVDISKLDEGKQAFVFGDALRTIYNLKLDEYSSDANICPPARIIVFIDELNKYAPSNGNNNSPILKEILEITERGRSLGIVLFAAEQFRSAIHDRVTGNCSTHAYGRTNTIELTKNDYKSIPNVYKTMLTRLKQGEYIIQNPIFRSLLHIKFPKPIYKQFKN